jgi:hypothetical protein
VSALGATQERTNPNMPALKTELEELVAHYPVITEVNRKKGKD